MKYIVYKTTNLVNSYIYIGVHKTEDPDIFDGYIGCGVYIQKPYTYEKSKTAFLKAVKEFGVKKFYREIIATYDNEDDAFALEAEIVNKEFLTRADVYNMVLGGEKYNGRKIKIYLYDENGKYINCFDSYEDAARIMRVLASSIRRAVVYKYRVHNTYFTNNKLDKICITDFNTNIKVKNYRYLKSGEYDKEFESYSEAARESDSSSANIGLAVILGICINDLYYFSTIKEESYDKARCKYLKMRTVHKYDSNGNYICSYKTLQQAEYDNPFSNITKSIKLKEIDQNGFLWGLEKLDRYNIPKRKRNKHVIMMDDNGNVLKEWASGRECAREVGSAVQNVLNGKYKKHKGYIYKYL